ncbi:unnamed protein product [Lasius platythorax]|uniref:Uncharacterized protein n=1 Tax=Lasius platythorax TaxID=488582 RepID=A0AAV2NCL1_9HYME
MSSPSQTIAFSQASSYQLEKDFFELVDIDSQVCRLQALLENEDLTLDTECLLQMLMQCLSKYTVESLDEQVFKKVLPKAQHFLSQIVRSIDDTIMGDNARIDDLDGVKYKLRICDGVLAFWKKCIEHVSTLGKVRAPYVTSLCDILPETIKIVFEHCKASQKYGVLLSGAMQELRNLFTRGGAIFKLFFATLNGVIVFDTDVQSETELLTKVIDAYGSIASIANGMDTKTFVELSEAFAKLALVYHDDIKPNSVTMHLAQMAKDVSCLLSTIKDQKDKNAERSIMVAMRLLKVLEKLTAAYNECLTYETMPHLVELTAHMHRYSCFSLSKGDERTISINATSFLDVIFNHDDFKQVYFQYGRQIVSHDQHVNYHLLTIAIMKKLNNMPYEHYCKWSLGSDSILDVALTYIEYLGEEICVGELRLSGDCHEIDGPPQLISVYETTLIFFCNLVSKIRSEDFHTLETLLLKYLLCGHFWSSLLSSDVWCFIGRLGTSQLCADHIKHLIKVSVTLIERRDSIEAIMLDHMIISLFELLTEDMKSTLLKDLVENLNTNNYVPILYLLIAKTKGFSSERLRHNFEDLPKAFLDLQEHPSIRNWKRLMQSVSAMVAMDYSDNKDIIEILTKIWSFVEDAIIECEGKQLNILSDLLVSLLDATHVGSLQDNIFCSILKSIATSCVYLPSRGKIKICHFLRRSVDDLDCGVQSVASILTGLFVHLLENENPWVRQEALETFEHMGQRCSEQLIAKIAKALAKIPNISSVMQAYLSSRPYYSLEGFANIQDYLRYLVGAIKNRDGHTCYKYNESEREEKIPRMEKEGSSRDVIMPISIQLDERAEELCKGLAKVLEDRAVISDTVCRKLIAILEKILRAK